MNPNQESKQNELAQFAKDGLRDWVSISRYILEVDEKGSWSVSNRTFTDWLTALSVQLDITESGLWRYYRAGKYYQALAENLKAKGVDTPPFKLLPKKISPENLETLEKIERVAPENIFNELATRVIQCSIKRSELRSEWVAYRKVLDGKTARGIGVVAPRADLTNRIQLLMIGEAEVQAALNSASKGWTGFDAPQMYKVVPKLRIKVNEKSFKSFEADAVILFQGDLNAPVEFFEIDIKSHNGVDVSYDSFLKKGSYFDRQWVAFHQFNDEIGLANIPPCVGVILLDGCEFKVLRKAVRSPLAATKSLETAKVLLTKFLKG
jgi:hypothetical protein